MSSQPTKLQLEAEDTLRIDWSDGAARRYKVRELREGCPCAHCREKKKKPPEPAAVLPVITAQEAAPLRIAKMDPVGSYAYSIHFSDGHDTGIYTLELLRELGSEA